MAFLLLLGIGSTAFGQPTPLNGPSADGAEPGGAMNFEDGRRLLEDVEDHVFSFDDPAFYWFCRWVREDGDSAAYIASPQDEPVDWRFLMERPSDYRGELVTIEGKLLRREAFEVPNREGVGRLTQCDLTDVGTRAVCTAILTEGSAQAPIGSQVRVRGYFIKIRSFKTTAGDTGIGPLIVTRDLERFAAPGGPPDSSDRMTLMYKWLIGAIGVLGLLWVATRRMSRLRSQESGLTHASSLGKITETDEDFEWLTDSTPEGKGGDRNDD